MSGNVIKFCKRRRPKNVSPEAAAVPATVTQLPRPRPGLLEQELQRKFDSLDEAGKQFMNGYMQALLDQAGAAMTEDQKKERANHKDEMKERIDLIAADYGVPEGEIARVYKGVAQEHMTQACGFFERALTIDPRSVGALVGMAMVDLTIGASLLADDRAACSLAAETNAIKALSLAPDHPLAHRVLGGVYIFTNRAAQGIAECELALALDRNLADAHGAIGIAKYFIGRAAETEAHILEALRLSPRDVVAHRWMHIVGMAKIQLGADAEAAAWLREALKSTATFLLPIFGSLRPSACSAHWMTHKPLQRWDSRSIQALPSAACLSPNQAVIRVISLDESASARACA